MNTQVNTAGRADLEAARNAAYPVPDSPHASVNMRAVADRTAFTRGWDAALAARQAPDLSDYSLRDLQMMGDLAHRLLWIAFVWNDHNFEAAHIVARKTAATWGITSFDEANAYLESKRAPAAQPLQQEGGKEVPAGWKLVPEEPTDEMLHEGGLWAAFDAFDHPDTGLEIKVINMGDVWRYMLNAAPQPSDNLQQASTVQADNDKAAQQLLIQAMDGLPEFHGDLVYLIEYIADPAVRRALRAEIAKYAAKAKNGHPASATDAGLLAQAIEQVDGCMDETQVEPEDAAAWQVVRKHIAPAQAAPIDHEAVAAVNPAKMDNGLSPGRYQNFTVNPLPTAPRPPAPKHPPLAGGHRHKVGTTTPAAGQDLPPLPEDMDIAERISLSSIDCHEFLEVLGAYAQKPDLDTAWAVLQCADRRMHHIMRKRFALAASQQAGGKPNVDCSGTPANCPDNEGYGCACSSAVAACEICAGTGTAFGKACDCTKGASHG